VCGALSPNALNRFRVTPGCDAVDIAINAEAGYICQL
jgi:hypothetical protein